MIRVKFLIISCLIKKEIIIFKIRAHDGCCCDADLFVWALTKKHWPNYSYISAQYTFPVEFLSVKLAISSNNTMDWLIFYVDRLQTLFHGLLQTLSEMKLESSKFQKLLLLDISMIKFLVTWKRPFSLLKILKLFFIEDLQFH